MSKSLRGFSLAAMVVRAFVEITFAEPVITGVSFPTLSITRSGYPFVDGYGAVPRDTPENYWTEMVFSPPARWVAFDGWLRTEAPLGSVVRLATIPYDSEGVMTEYVHAVRVVGRKGEFARIAMAVDGWQIARLLTEALPGIAYDTVRFGYSLEGFPGYANVATAILPEPTSRPG